MLIFVHCATLWKSTTVSTSPFLDRLALKLTRRPRYPGRRTIARIASRLTPKVVRQTINFDGVCWDMVLDKRDAYQLDIYYFGSYDNVIDTEVAFLLRHLLKPGSIFWDIGANVGWFSIYAGTLMPSAHILAVEPAPTTYTTLEHNIRINNIQNVTCLRVALANTHGTFALEIVPDNSGFSHLVHGNASTPYSIDAPCTTLDQLVAQQGIAPTLIKIDAEGAEPLIIAGGRNLLLREDSPSLIVEVNHPTLHAFGFSVGNLIDMLQQYGYTVTSINPDGTLNEKLPLERSYFNAFATKRR